MDEAIVLGPTVVNALEIRLDQDGIRIDERIEVKALLAKTVENGCTEAEAFAAATKETALEEWRRARAAKRSSQGSSSIWPVQIASRSAAWSESDRPSARKGNLDLANRMGGT